MTLAGLQAVTGAALALAVRGWAVVPDGDVNAILSGWRCRAPVTAPARRWWAALPVGPDEPVGPVRRALVIGPGLRFEMIPGSQGMATAAAEPVYALWLGGEPGQSVLVDARCLVRLDAGRHLSHWEAG
jgi:hypothetical protein